MCLKVAETLRSCYRNTDREQRRLVCLHSAWTVTHPNLLGPILVQLCKKFVYAKYMKDNSQQFTKTTICESVDMFGYVRVHCIVVHMWLQCGCIPQSTVVSFFDPTRYRKCIVITAKTKLLFWQTEFVGRDASFTFS